jgi:hypothetical protein
MLQSEIMQAAADAGIGEPTLKRAKKQLDVKSYREGTPAAWWWMLSDFQGSQDNDDLGPLE